MPSRGARGVAGGDEHHRVAGADDDGAVGLLGQLAGFDRDACGSRCWISRFCRLTLCIWTSSRAERDVTCGCRDA